MVWWIVPLLALVLSPLAWLRPSRRQSAQMDIRLEARRMGLAMNLARQEWPHWLLHQPPTSCAQYHRARRADRSDSWSYWQNDGEWLNQWREPCADAALLEQLRSLPADVYKVETDARMIALYWGERDPQALPQVAAVLKILA